MFTATFNKENRCDVANMDDVSSGARAGYRPSPTARYFHDKVISPSMAVAGSGHSHAGKPLVADHSVVTSPTAATGTTATSASGSDSADLWSTVGTSKFMEPEPTPRHASKPAFHRATHNHRATHSHTHAVFQVNSARSGGGSAVVMSREAPSPHEPSLGQPLMSAMSPDFVISPASQQPRAPPASPTSALSPLAVTAQMLTPVRLTVAAEPPTIRKEDLMATVRRVDRHPVTVAADTVNALAMVVEDKHNNSVDHRAPLVIAATSGHNDSHNDTDHDRDSHHRTISLEITDTSIVEISPVNEFAQYLVRTMLAWQGKGDSAYDSEYDTFASEPPSVLLTAYEKAHSHWLASHDSLLQEAHRREVQKMRGQLDRDLKAWNQASFQREQALKDQLESLRSELEKQRAETAAVHAQWDDEKRAREQRRTERRQQRRDDELNQSLTLTNQTLNTTFNNSINMSALFGSTQPSLPLQPPRTIVLKVTVDGAATLPSCDTLALSAFSRTKYSNFSTLYRGQTEKQFPMGRDTIIFDRPLTIPQVYTNCNKHSFRLSLYAPETVRHANGDDITNNRGLGNVELDPYTLYTAWSSNGAIDGIVSENSLTRQERIDSVSGKSERTLRVSVSPYTSAVVHIHAIITPPLTADSYPNPLMKGLEQQPHQVTLDMSAINTSLLNSSRYSLHGESFIDEPVSPILPHTRACVGAATPMKTPKASLAAPVLLPAPKSVRDSECQTELVGEVMLVSTVRMVDSETQCEPAAISPTTTSMESQTDPVAVTDTPTRIADDRVLSSPSAKDEERDDPGSPLKVKPSTLSSLLSPPSQPSSRGNTPIKLKTTGHPGTSGIIAVSNALNVSFPYGFHRISGPSQAALIRVIALLRRQWRDAVQWFPHDNGESQSKSSKPKASWNPSNNPSSHLKPRAQLITDISAHAHWQADANNCSSCDKAFSFISRRHHCRLCGNAACAECTARSVDLTDYGLSGKERVCDLCETVWKVGKGIKKIHSAKASERDGDIGPTKQPIQSVGTSVTVTNHSGSDSGSHAGSSGTVKATPRAPSRLRPPTPRADLQASVAVQRKATKYKFVQQ